LIELFLWKALELPWDEVHGEAENLEHAVSDRLINRIDEYLGYPKLDPHGDPIPSVDGDVPVQQGESLASYTDQTRFVLVRVPDDSPEFLRYLSQNGLEMGAEAVVVSNNPSAGVLTVQTDSGHISIGRDMASRLIVRRAQSTP
jgi:DtxR family Mn-dependent transcriptional regulator